MRDTPITDLMVERAPVGLRINSAFEQACQMCRELERELNAANEHIKRLEEALESAIKFLEFFGPTSGFDASCELLKRELIKAKESKP